MSPFTSKLYYIVRCPNRTWVVLVVLFKPTPKSDFLDAAAQSDEVRVESKRCLPFAENPHLIYSIATPYLLRDLPYLTKYYIRSSVCMRICMSIYCPSPKALSPWQAFWQEPHQTPEGVIARFRFLLRMRSSRLKYINS